MVIGILAALLGLLLSVAAIVIPRIVARHNDSADHAGSLAYLASTGRTAQDVIRANQASPGEPGGAGSEPANADSADNRS